MDFIPVRSAPHIRGNLKPSARTNSMQTPLIVHRMINYITGLTNILP